jgi:hypothetical protein
MASATHRVLGAALVCGMTLAASAAASAPALAAAKESAKVGFYIAAVRKPSLRFQAKPGATITGHVRVQNLAARPRTVRLAASDLVTADTGGPSFPAATPNAIGTWLKLDRDEVRLTAHAGTTVAFRARVPAQTKPGEHYAGIVAVDAAQADAARKPAKARGRVSVHQLARLALPVRLTVPGPLSTRLALTKLRFGVDASGSSLRIGLRNAGNQIIRQTAIDLEVTTQDGRSLLEIREDVSDFITGSEISYPAAWRGPLKRGSYRVTGVIRPRGGPPLRVDQTIAFTPKLADKLKRKTGRPAAPNDGQAIWMWVALAMALTAACVITVAYLRLRRRLRTASP